VFPLSAQNKMATYNWDIGTIERPTNEERQFEVASHQWFDLTDASGAYGVTVLSDCKIASDKPNDNTLRLTLIRTPGTRGGYEDQGTQDIGHHAFVYGIAGHSGSFRTESTDWQALRLNQPLVAFETGRHEGRLGKSFAMLKVSNPRIRVLAFKKAEAGDEFIVRLVELDGQKADDVRVSFAAPVVAAREVNGAEEPVGAATVKGGELATSFTAFQPRTFAVKLGPAVAKPGAVVSRAVTLPYNQAVASPDGAVSAGDFDGNGRALAAELLPADIAFGPVHFAIAPTAGVKPNAVTPRGQSITLPTGKFTRLYVLAAATTDADQTLRMKVGDAQVTLKVPSWGGYVGQWDNRTWTTREEPVAPRPGQPAPAPGTPPRMRTVQEMTGLIPGYTRRSTVAWFASHRHATDGTNDPYAYSYLYAYSVDVPLGTKTLTLPWNERVRILAMTVSDERDGARPVQPLFDTLERPATTVATTNDK
jgi:alpha-mannosidase